jgi:hypothetical protein
LQEFAAVYQAQLQICWRDNSMNQPVSVCQLSIEVRARLLYSTKSYNQLLSNRDGSVVWRVAPG